MRKPAIAAPRRTPARRGGRPIDPARRPNESAARDPADENASRSSLLFPVIVITGNSDVNDIKDLAISRPIEMRETLHLVFWDAGSARLGLSRDQAGPAGIKSGRPSHGGFSGKFLGFLGTWHWPRGYSLFLHRLCPDCHSACPSSRIHQINSRVKALYDLFMGQVWSFLGLFNFLGSAGSRSLGYGQVALSYVVDIVVDMTQTVPPVPPSAAVSI